MADDSASCGNPCAACQARFGAAISRPAARPATATALRSAARGPATSSPTSEREPAGTPATACSAARSRRPAPAANHQRPGPATSSRSARTTSQLTAVQTSRSSVLVDSRCPTAGSSADTAMAPAASSCAPAGRPELAGEQPGEQHDESGHQRRGRPEPDERAREQHVHRVRQQRGERGLVGVAERGLGAGPHEVQLVAVVPVAARGGQQQRADRGADGAQPRPGHRVPGTNRHGASGARGCCAVF